MEKQKNSSTELRRSAPQLRFPNFNDKWIEKEIGEILKIGSGKDYREKEQGEIPVYGSGGYMTSINDYLHDGETVCIGRKGTIDSPLYFNAKIWTVDTLFYTHSFINANVKFIYNVFQKINWKKYSEASGVPSLSKSTIEKISITLPTLPEQQKIASFLTAVDDKLQSLKKKKELLEQYKKGVMQKIFPSTGSGNTQEIRFKITNQDGELIEPPEWEKKKLGQIFMEINEAIGTRNIETYSISAGKGFISQKEKFGKDISGQQNEKYIVVNPDQFSYNKGNSKTYTYGCVYLNNTGKTIAVPNVFISFKLTDSRMSSNYFAKLFEHHYLDKGLRRIISSTARMDGLLNINKKYFFDLIIPVPTINEQIKIGEFLSALDKKIGQVAELVKATEQWKKGLLQKMFV